jgi:hypothetical protein
VLPFTWEIAAAQVASVRTPNGFQRPARPGRIRRWLYPQ